MKARLDAVSGYTRQLGIELVEHRYDIENFFKAIDGNMGSPDRCKACWRMRLYESGDYAKRHGFGAFTTTLLVSPYQDRDEIVKIGSEIGKMLGIFFIGTDWRNGFREAQDFAKQNGMYRQKYCGCIFSERERYCKR